MEGRPEGSDRVVKRGIDTDLVLGDERKDAINEEKTKHTLRKWATWLV